MNKSNLVQISWKLPKCDSCGAQVRAYKMAYGIVSECPNRKWFNFWLHHRQQLSWEQNERFLTIGKLQIDRSGIGYNLTLFLTVGYGLVAFRYFDGYAVIPAFFSHLASLFILGQIVTEWQREKFRKKS